jgi:Xaa-Pro dipeptidase
VHFQTKQSYSIASTTEMLQLFSTNSGIKLQGLGRKVMGQAEFRNRRLRLLELAGEGGLDAVLINSDSNHRYLTGHWSGRWTSRTRPIVLLLSKMDEPTILCSVVEEQTAQMHAEGCRVRAFGGSGHDLEAAIEAVAEQLRALGLDRGRIGVEFGPHHRPQMPPGGYELLKHKLPDLTYVDVGAMLWRLRMRKSPAEIIEIRRSTEITDAMYARVHSWLPTAATERVAYNRIARELLELGADQTGYLNVLADTTEKLGGGFTDRPFRADRLVYIDAGCIVNGYWSDHARIFCMGAPSPSAEKAYEQLWGVTERMIEISRPGVRVHEIYALALDEIEKATGTRPMLGRVGHSMGLEMPEPPSICAEEDLLLEPGMILNIEPSLRLLDVGTLIAEEVIAVTADGCELLTRRAPMSIPRLALPN